MVTIQDLESQIGVYLNAVSKILCVPMPPILKIRVVSRFNTGRTINKCLYRFLPLFFFIFVTLSEKKNKGNVDFIS